MKVLNVFSKKKLSNCISLIMKKLIKLKRRLIRNRLQKRGKYSLRVQIELKGKQRA